jgi:DNA-binding NarL/FixJ family response regulator
VVELTPSLLRVTQLVTEGHDNTEIGRMLGGRSRYGIANDIKEILDRTSMGNRLELALWFLANENDPSALRVIDKRTEKRR